MAANIVPITQRRRSLLALTLAIIAGVVIAGLTPVSAHAAVRVIHVAKTGSDSNSGTDASPYLTINKAAQEAQPGDTVKVHAGLYRETVKPARGGSSEATRITYTNAGDGEVIIRGSEELNSWTSVGGNVWSVVVPNSTFGAWNPFANQHPNLMGNNYPASNAGAVYLDGRQYNWKTTLAQVQSTGSAWTSTVDASNTTVWANFNGSDPNARLAEINVRKQLFAPDVWGLGYITVNGFTIQQSGNLYSDFPGEPARTQAGAISVNGGLKWIIERNVITDSRTIAIDIGLGNDTWAGNKSGAPASSTRTDFHNTTEYGSHIVRNNYIARSGQSGVAGVFSWNSDILFNRIEDTNYLDEFSSAETAPIKVHYMNEGLIKGNYIRNSKGANSVGIWVDWGNQNARVTQNVVVNAKTAFLAEAAHGPILVDNNVFIGEENKWIRNHNSTGVVFAHNMFLNISSISSSGPGINAYYFAPGTMNQSTAFNGPGKYWYLNNLVLGDSALPTDTEKQYVLEGNVGNSGISNVSYSASWDQVKISFTLAAGAMNGLTPVTQSRVGVLPNANQPIPSDVSTDFFDKNRYPANVVAGPFRNLNVGLNEIVLWPNGEQVVPPPTPTVLTASPAAATASFSSTGTPAKYAIDGSIWTRWSSNGSNDPGAWLAVDLGASYQIAKASIAWETAYASAYKVQVSSDNATWTDAYSTSAGRGDTEIVPVNQVARYIRMKGVTPKTQYGYSIREFTIEGTPVVTAYSETGYSGATATLAVGDYDGSRLRAAGLWNDSISSLRVPAGYTVTAWADAGYTGTSWTITGDTANLTTLGANDKISSLKITQ